MACGILKPDLQFFELVPISDIEHDGPVRSTVVCGCDRPETLRSAVSQSCSLTRSDFIATVLILKSTPMVPCIDGLGQCFGEPHQKRSFAAPAGPVINSLSTRSYSGPGGTSPNECWSCQATCSRRSWRLVVALVQIAPGSLPSDQACGHEASTAAGAWHPCATTAPRTARRRQRRQTCADLPRSRGVRCARTLSIPSESSSTQVHPRLAS